MEIRTELNVRLRDGQTGRVVLGWLNGLEPVRTVLAKEFKGAPVNDPNLTAWRTSGYVEWEEQETALKLGQELRGGVMSDEEAGMEVAFTAVTLKVAELSRFMMRKETEPEKQWEWLQRANRMLCRLRRDRCREMELKVEQRRLELRGQIGSAEGQL